MKIQYQKYYLRYWLENLIYLLQRYYFTLLAWIVRTCIVIFLFFLYLQLVIDEILTVETAKVSFFNFLVLFSFANLRYLGFGFC